MRICGGRSRRSRAPRGPRHKRCSCSAARSGDCRLAITHLAEESSRRTPGSADLARKCLLAIADGVYTFTQCFNRTDGLYVAAQRGGTGRMRETARGEHPIDDLLGGYMDGNDNG